jgi:hypothetical protein
VAVGADGSVFVGGTFSGSADFGAGFLVSRGSSDAYVVKYDADGAILWSRSFGGCSGDGLAGLAIDDDGGVIVAANVSYVSGDPPCDPYFGGERIPTGFAPGPYGALAALTRYDADGAELTARAFGPPGSTTTFEDIAYDGGRVAVVGFHNNGVAFGNGISLAAGGFDGLVALLAASDGDAVWARSITGDNVSVDFTAVDLDADHLLIAGYFDDDVAVGAPQALLPAGSDDVALVSYARDDGAYQWHRQLGGIASDKIGGVAIGPDGSPWLAGSFTGTAYFGGGPLVAASRDGAAARFDADGEHLVSVATDTAADDEWTAIAAYADGGAAVAGVNTTVDTGVVTRLDASAGERWTQIITSTTSVTPAAVALGPDGSVVVVGRFEGTVSLGDLPSAASAGMADSFIIKLAP